MKPYRLMLPLLLTTPAMVPVVSAVASNPSFRPLDSDGPVALDAGPFEQVKAVAFPPPATAQAEPLIAQEVETPRRPVMPPPPPTATTVPTVVRLGDTLLKIAQRYGLTIGELLQLNPGLETARLVVGSQVQVVRSAPGRSRMLLGLAPVGSGGLSWPELPPSGLSSVLAPHTCAVTAV